jgi:hypothetical protein
VRHTAVTHFTFAYTHTTKPPQVALGTSPNCLYKQYAASAGDQFGWQNGLTSRCVPVTWLFRCVWWWPRVALSGVRLMRLEAARECWQALRSSHRPPADPLHAAAPPACHTPNPPAILHTTTNTSTHMYQFPDTSMKDGWRDSMCYKAGCDGAGALQLDILGQKVACPSGQMVDLAKVCCCLLVVTLWNASYALASYSSKCQPASFTVPALYIHTSISTTTHTTCHNRRCRGSSQRACSAPAPTTARCVPRSAATRAAPWAARASRDSASATSCTQVGAGAWAWAWACVVCVSQSCWSV